MQGGNRRQNRRNHPKKPEDPAFRREVRFGDRDGHRGEIQREQFFFWVISCHFQINVSVGCSWHMLYLHCELDGSWMALAPHKRPRHGGLPRCHPKFQEARFKKPVPQGELKRLPELWSHAEPEKRDMRSQECPKDHSDSMVFSLNFLKVKSWGKCPKLPQS